MLVGFVNDKNTNFFHIGNLNQILRRYYKKIIKNKVKRGNFIIADEML